MVELILGQHPRVAVFYATIIFFAALISAIFALLNGYFGILLASGMGVYYSTYIFKKSKPWLKSRSHS